MTQASLTAAHPWRAHLICMAAMMCWSTGLPANTYLMPTLHPLPLAGLRFMIAALVLLPFWLAFDGWAALRGANWGRGLLAGSAIGLGGSLVILGQAWTDPVTVAVIAAALPVIGIGTEIALDGTGEKWCRAGRGCDFEWSAVRAGDGGEAFGRA